MLQRQHATAMKHVEESWTKRRKVQDSSGTKWYVHLTEIYGTSKDDTMQCRLLPREHRTPGLP